MNTKLSQYLFVCLSLFMLSCVLPNSEQVQLQKLKPTIDFDSFYRQQNSETGVLKNCHSYLERITPSFPFTAESYGSAYPDDGKYASLTTYFKVVFKNCNFNQDEVIEHRYMAYYASGDKNTFSSKAIPKPFNWKQTKYKMTSDEFSFMDKIYHCTIYFLIPETISEAYIYIETILKDKQKIISKGIPFTLSDASSPYCRGAQIQIGTEY